MLASSILVISGLVAIAQGALMPRQSTTTARPGCFRCPGVNFILFDANLRPQAYPQSDGSLLCMYYDNSETNQVNCVYQGTTGAAIRPSDDQCLYAIGSATPAAFECPSSAGPANLVYFDFDSTANTVCYYRLGASADLFTCQYDPVTGDLEVRFSGPGCASTVEACASTSRRAYKGDNNFAAVKRRQATRAHVTLVSRHLDLDSRK